MRKILRYYYFEVLKIDWFGKLDAVDVVMGLILLPFVLLIAPFSILAKWLSKR